LQSVGSLKGFYSIPTATDEYKQEYITYEFTNEQVDNNLKYFKSCLNDNLSAYKALLFFNDYLNGEFDV
jgi:hypothetical protein